MNAPLNHKPKSRSRRGIVAASVTAVTAVGLIFTVVTTAVKSRDSQTQEAIDLLQKGGPSAARGQAMARELLEGSPYNVPLLGALALAKDRNGQKKEAAALMTAAGDLSWRDANSNIWLVQNELSTGKYVSAVKRADALLRTRPQAQDFVFPILVAVASDPGASRAIAERLAYRPEWREPFLVVLNQKAEPQVSFGLLNQLKVTRAPPNVREVSGFVKRLMDLKRYDEALLAVLLFLPADRLGVLENIFNGGFQDVSGIAPFDWVNGSVAGADATMEVPPSRPNDRALHVLHDGVSRGDVIYQALALPAGQYRFAGEAMSATPKESQRVQWTISCIGGPALLGAPVAANETWSGFSATFEVPQNCGAQWLQLSQAQGERRTTVDIWYDKLVIVRQAPA